MTALAVLAAASQSWFVATNGVDGGGGGDGSISSPFSTVRQAMVVADYGDTIYLRGGTYRQSINAFTDGTRLHRLDRSQGSAAKQLTIRNYGSETVIITGSDLPGAWVSTNGPTAGLGYWRTPWTNNTRQVFVNGRRLTQIGWTTPLDVYPNTTTNVNIPLVGAITVDGVSVLDQEYSHLSSPWSFYFSGSSMFICLPSEIDPNAELVEISTRRIVNVLYPRVTIKGITFRHSATMIPNGGVPAVSIGALSTLENCTVEDCDWFGASMRDGSKMIGCTFKNNAMGGAIVWGTNMLVSGCRFLTNHYLSYDLRGEAAGMKVIGVPAYLDGSTWQYNEFAYNNGEGLWFDSMSTRPGKSFLINRNYSHDNSSCGLMLEFSTGAWFVNNLSKENRRRALYISQSGDSRVVNNVLLAPELSESAVAIAGGIGPYESTRPRNLWLVNNVIGKDELTSGSYGTNLQVAVYGLVGACTGITNIVLNHNRYLIRGDRPSSDYFYFNNITTTLTN